MNREIKFRAWGRWGDFNENDDSRDWIMIDGDSLCFEDFEPISNLLSDIEDEAYFMQYTGLKDKYGVEIYEGDILSSLTAPVPCAITVDDYHGYQFKFGKGLLCKADALYGQVIGNIYENPELLQPARELK